MVGECVIAESGFDVPEFDGVIPRCRDEMRATIGFRIQASCCVGFGGTRSRGSFQHFRGEELDSRNSVIVSSQGSEANVGAEIPEFNGEIHRRRGQVRTFGCKGQVRNSVRMPLQSSNVVSTLVIPDL